MEYGEKIKNKMGLVYGSFRKRARRLINYFILGYALSLTIIISIAFYLGNFLGIIDWLLKYNLIGKIGLSMYYFLWIYGFLLLTKSTVKRTVLR